MRTAALLLLLALAPARAGPPKAVEKEIARLRGLAKKFEERGRTGDAERQLHEALSLAPTSLDVLGDLLRLSEKRADVFELWAHYLAAHSAARPKGVSTAILRALEPAFKTAKIRANVIERLASMVKRLRRPADVPGSAGVPVRLLYP